MREVTKGVLAFGWALLLAAGCGKLDFADYAPPSGKPFGVTAKGETCSLYTLKGAGGLTLEVTDFGGRLVRCWAPDRDGKLANVTLGFDTVGEYETNGFCVGTLIGRFGNRIRDGRFALDGQTHQLAVNETKPAPRHCNLHSGPDGWDAKVWKAEAWREQPGPGDAYVPCLTLTLVSPDGDMGFPGTVTCTVTYKVLPDNTWTIDYEATTDRPTVINPTHHTYWNLAGEPYPRFAGLAFETQHYPDSPNRPEFPSTVLRPGEVFRSRTEYRHLAL